MPRAREDWTGIHDHAGGWQAVVSRGPNPLLKRWFRRHTPLSVMQKWRETEKAKWVLERDARAAKTANGAPPGTFSTDVDRYLKHPDARKKPTFGELDTQLKRWTRELGDRSQSDIDSATIRGIRDRWANEARSETNAKPLSAGRVNKLVATLSGMYRTLYGRGGYNPCRGISPLTESQGPVRNIPLADVRKIIAAMPDRGRPVKDEPRASTSKTKARVMVLAATGLPEGTLMKLRRQDLNLKKRLIYRPERLKGQGVEASPQPLTADGVAAFKEFDRLKCWGPFSRASLWKSFRRAVIAAGIKGHVRPYDLRHTFLTELGKVFGDEAAIMDIAQHKNIQTTRRYTRGSMSFRALAAVKAFDKAHHRRKKATRKKRRAA